jgi:hypothetical protein
MPGPIIPVPTTLAAANLVGDMLSFYRHDFVLASGTRALEQ